MNRLQKVREKWWRWTYSTIQFLQGPKSHLHTATHTHTHTHTHDVCTKAEVRGRSEGTLHTCSSYTPGYTLTMTHPHTLTLHTRCALKVVHTDTVTHPAISLHQLAPYTPGYTLVTLHTDTHTHRRCFRFCAPPANSSASHRPLTHRHTWHTGGRFFF